MVSSLQEKDIEVEPRIVSEKAAAVHWDASDAVTAPVSSTMMAPLLAVHSSRVSGYY